MRHLRRRYREAGALRPLFNFFLIVKLDLAPRELVWPDWLRNPEGFSRAAQDASPQSLSAFRSSLVRCLDPRGEPPIREESPCRKGSAFDSREELPTQQKCPRSKGRAIDLRGKPPVQGERPRPKRRALGCQPATPRRTDPTETHRHTDKHTDTRTTPVGLHLLPGHTRSTNMITLALTDWGVLPFVQDSSILTGYRFFFKI